MISNAETRSEPTAGGAANPDQEPTASAVVGNSDSGGAAVDTATPPAIAPPPAAAPDGPSASPINSPFTRPAPARDPAYTGVELLECGCALTPEYQAMGAVLNLCHHSTPQEIAELNQRLLTLLAEQPVTFTMADFLKKTPESLRDHYIREILHTDYNFRNKEENAALAAACLRQLALGLMALLTGYLLDLDRNRPAPGVAEPDADPEDLPASGAC